jgi:hypothetical protein
MDKFIERKKGDFVKYILSHLELVSIPYADPHLLEALIELILFFFQIHGVSPIILE